jgi:hypothetical protein
MKYLVLIMFLVCVPNIQAQSVYLGGAWGGVYSGRPFFALGLDAELDREPWLLSGSVRFLKGAAADRHLYMRMPRHAGTPEGCYNKETGEEVPLGKCAMQPAGRDWGLSLTRRLLGDVHVGGAVHHIQGRVQPTVSIMMRRRVRDGDMGVTFNFDWGSNPTYVNMSYIFSWRL